MKNIYIYLNVYNVVWSVIFLVKLKRNYDVIYEISNKANLLIMCFNKNELYIKVEQFLELFLYLIYFDQAFIFKNKLN